MINILIVGTGEIASRFMLGLNQIDGINVTGVYSRDILNAKKFSETWGIKYFIDDLNDFCGDIHIAYICTPNNTHYFFSSELIKKGINVLVEKPIVTNLIEFHELIKMASYYKVNVLDGMWTLYNPLIKSAFFISKKYTPLSIRSYLCFDNPPKSNVLTDVLNGGAVRDILTYQLYLVILFFKSEGLNLLSSYKFYNEKNIDYRYILEVESDNKKALLEGNIKSRNSSNFIINYKDFRIIIINPIYNPKFIIFLPQKYFNIKMFFLCFIYNIICLFSSARICANRIFLKSYFYKNPLHIQLRELIDKISGEKEVQTIPLKMTSIVVAILDKVVK